MAETPTAPTSRRPPSVPRRRAGSPIVWIIPILAAVVAVGIAVQRILSEGPTITIVFKAAEGIEAGKTFVKYKDVNIGQVTAVQLDRRLRQGRGDREDRQERGGPDGRGREVLGRRAAHQPERGLRTRHAALRQLHRLRGRASRPRSSAPSPALEVPPIITGGKPGRQFVAARPPTSARSASARRSTTAACRPARSSPTTWHPTARRSTSRSSSTRPTTSTSTPSTRFWNASGIDVSVGASGVDVRTRVAGRAARGRHRLRHAAPSRRTPSPPPRTRCSRSTATAPPR